MRSATYEEVLKRQGVDFTYLPRLDLNAIDVQAGLHNQARMLNPLDDELIDQYTTWYKEGSDGPPLVVYEKKGTRKRTWVPMDGNQRIQAGKKANKKTLDAYVVQSHDPLVIDRITWSFNNLVNGKRISREEALEHAISMVEKYSADAKIAAKEFGVPYKTVNQRLQANKLRKILHARGADQATTLSDEKLEDLNTFTHLGEDVFVVAATTAQRCGLSRQDILTLKDDVKKAKTHNDKVKAVLNFAETDLAKERRAETKGGTTRATRGGISPAQRLVQYLKTLERHLAGHDRTALRRLGNSYKEVHTLAGDVVDQLILLFGLGSRPHKQHQEAV